MKIWESMLLGAIGGGLSSYLLCAYVYRDVNLKTSQAIDELREKYGIGRAK